MCIRDRGFLDFIVEPGRIELPTSCLQRVFAPSMGVHQRLSGLHSQGQLKPECPWASTNVSRCWPPMWLLLLANTLQEGHERSLRNLQDSFNFFGVRSGAGSECRLARLIQF